MSTKEPLYSPKKQQGTIARNWRKPEQFLNPLIPIVNHEVVEDQRTYINCFQAKYTGFLKKMRTVSESSKQLVVVEQITTSKLRKTNPRSQ